MRWKFAISSPRRARRGTTLIEAVASLALLGALLTALLLARSRVTRQMAAADRRLAAVGTADTLLNQWWQGGNLPRNSAGQTRDGFAWSTRVVRNAPAEQLGAAVLRLEVSDASPRPAMPPVVVELLVPAANNPGEDEVR